MINTRIGMTESVPSTIKEEELMQNGKLRVMKKNLRKNAADSGSRKNFIT